MEKDSGRPYVPRRLETLKPKEPVMISLIRKIDTAVPRTLSTEDILNLHDPSNNPKSNMNKKEDMITYPFVCEPLKVDPFNDKLIICKGIKVNPLGTLPPIFYSIASVYGLPFSQVDKHTVP
jgi:hypothetical protein